MSKKSDHPQALRTEALETLLIQKGILNTQQIDAIVKAYEENVGPMAGAQMVARAWVEQKFKSAMLKDGKWAMSQLGIKGAEAQHLEIVENTARIHNVVVCTLCSCYPWAILGLPPNWYKQPAYRSRIVKEPRTVLEEFGVSLGEDVEIRVWDSSAEVRYLVLPQRPSGTENLKESELARLVSRDAMIGVGIVKNSQYR